MKPLEIRAHRASCWGSTYSTWREAVLRLLVGSTSVAPLDLDQIHLHALHSLGGPDVLDDVLFRLILDGIAGAATAERVALLLRDVARDLVGAWRVALK
eukprot:212036-Rhodomonas_salina.1